MLGQMATNIKQGQKKKNKNKRILKVIGKTLLTLTVATGASALFLWLTMDRTGLPNNKAIVNT